jgi:hypothetical protein
LPSIISSEPPPRPKRPAPGPGGVRHGS